jgi:hypothetical protein
MILASSQITQWMLPIANSAAVASMSKDRGICKPSVGALLDPF